MTIQEDEMADQANRDAVLEGKWDQVKGRVREAWGALSDDDVDRSQGNWDQLIGTIREKTGETAESVENRLSGIIDKIQEMGSSDDRR